MKTLLLSICLFLSGCMVEHVDYAVDDGPYITGNFVYCDWQGCRDMYGVYYYADDGSIVYWDRHFGVWIGARGYWTGNVWYRGVPIGFYEYHRREFYHGAAHYYRMRGHGGRR